MSPFTQFGGLPGIGGYGGGIDRDFSPVLNYLDEFDRHFSRRHRFVNCFIPRFDLEEDAGNYYLYGDIPGAKLEEITVEAHNNHTLQIYGKTERLGVALPLQDQDPESSTSSNDFVKVNVEDASNSSTDHKGPLPPPSTSSPTQNAITNPAPIQGQVAPPAFPPPPTQQNYPHPHHERHHTFSTSSNATPPQSRNEGQGQAMGHHVLLSERLVGDFHRTFAFPSEVVEDGVRASLENGVLSVVVPKMERGVMQGRGRRVVVERGGR